MRWPSLRGGPVFFGGVTARNLRMELVVSHPSRDEAARRMGHPRLWMGEEAGVGLWFPRSQNRDPSTGSGQALHPTDKDPSAGTPALGHPAFFVYWGAA